MVAAHGLPWTAARDVIFPIASSSSTSSHPPLFLLVCRCLIASCPIFNLHRPGLKNRLVFWRVLFFWLLVQTELADNPSPHFFFCLCCCACLLCHCLCHWTLVHVHAIQSLYSIHGLTAGTVRPGTCPPLSLFVFLLPPTHRPTIFLAHPFR